jgi:hypothetical protein
MFFEGMTFARANKICQVDSRKLLFVLRVFASCYFIFIIFNLITGVA